MTDKVLPVASGSGSTVFDIACQILNREIEPKVIPEGSVVPKRLLPLAPDFLPNAASINRKIAETNRGIAIRNLSNTPYYRLLAFEKLRAFVASTIRYTALGQAAHKGIGNRILPAVQQQHKTVDEVDTSELWKELWESFESIAGPLLRQDRSVCTQVAHTFGATPKTVEDYRFQLLLAFYFHWEKRCKERIVPCAACPRFFVARTATALTCSDACRQRYYRETQDAVGRLRLREQARNHKSAQRERVRVSAAAKSQKAPAQKGKASGILHPSRKTAL